VRDVSQEEFLVWDVVTHEIAGLGETVAEMLEELAE
jgi:hypothetical protein